MKLNMTERNIVAEQIVSELEKAWLKKKNKIYKSKEFKDLYKEILNQYPILKELDSFQEKHKEFEIYIDIDKKVENVAFKSFDVPEYFNTWEARQKVAIMLIDQDGTIDQAIKDLTNKLKKKLNIE